MDDKRIAELADLIKKHGLSEIELEENGTRIRLVSGARVLTQAAGAPAYYPPPQAAAAAPAQVAKAGSPANLKEVKSPFVGTFYSSSSPDKPAFVKVGDSIRKGQVLCIVEAMKIMNEIEADRDGVIEQILADNEDAVEFDQALFVLS